MKRSQKNGIGRLVGVGLAILLQIAWILSLFIRLNRYFPALNVVATVAAGILALRIYGVQQNAAFKITWIMLLLAFPVFGLVVYGLFGQKNASKKMRLRYQKMDFRIFQELKPKPEVLERLEAENASVASQCRYLSEYCGFPVYRNTDVEFFAEAAEGFEAQLKELSKAEEFIFMEYHAIEEGQAFARLREVLADRAAHGVEVRLFYDEVGSVGFIDRSFIDRMKDLGIECRVFNPMRPILNIFMNNRDHRKITVIDGKVGFTGGYNLADEYFNITHPYGRWKDTGILLRGEAVDTLTVMFLEMWNVSRETDTTYEKYLRKCTYQAREAGYIQLYDDSPLNGEPVGENVYLNLIQSAQRSLYVMTPYLIISDEMNRALTLAAKRGVDVRVITPGIPDKKLIYKMTRSYYAGLVRGGVRVYEYTPGFLHAKQVICDGRVATVGTINFDYRSLYHHFENGTLLYEYQAIQKIARDFQDTLAVSREVTEQYREGRKTVLRLAQCFLRLFAPLL